MTNLDKNFTTLTGATFMTQSICMEVQNSCAGLSEEEVCDMLLLDREQFNEADKRYFNAAYKRGNALAKKEVVDALKKSMGDRNGAAAAINYLMRFGDKWESDIGDTSSAGTFAFNMITK